MLEGVRAGVQWGCMIGDTSVKYKDCVGVFIKIRYKRGSRLVEQMPKHCMYWLTVVLSM